MQTGLTISTIYLHEQRALCRCYHIDCPVDLLSVPTQVASHRHILQLLLAFLEDYAQLKLTRKSTVV